MSTGKDGTTALDRFWAKVRKTDTCWEWTGAKNPRGYGWSKVFGKATSAHRDAYQIARGPIPDGMDIDHMCHNRGCVNPDHLRAITHKQNTENRAGLDANNKSGARGVFWNKERRKWQGVVRHNGHGYHAGAWATVAEAERAVVAKRNELFTHNDADRVTR